MRICRQMWSDDDGPFDGDALPARRDRLRRRRRCGRVDRGCWSAASVSARHSAWSRSTPTPATSSTSDPRGGAQARACSTDTARTSVATRRRTAHRDQRRGPVRRRRSCRGWRPTPVSASTRSGSVLAPTTRSAGSSGPAPRCCPRLSRARVSVALGSAHERPADRRRRRVLVRHRRPAAARGDDEPHPAPARVRRGGRAHPAGVGARRRLPDARSARPVTRCVRSSSCSPTCSGSRCWSTRSTTASPPARRSRRCSGRSTSSTRPPRALGDDISLDGVGDPLVVAGRVRDLDGTSGAGRAASTSGRPAPTGSTTCSSPTCSRSATCVACSRPTTRAGTGSAPCLPKWYPIPDDGPVGDLLGATGRHPNRPAHVHVIAGAAGHAPRHHARVPGRQPVAGLRRRVRGAGEPGPRGPRRRLARRTASAVRPAGVRRGAARVSGAGVSSWDQRFHHGMQVQLGRFGHPGRWHDEPALPTVFVVGGAVRLHTVVEPQHPRDLS